MHAHEGEVCVWHGASTSGCRTPAVTVLLCMLQANVIAPNKHTSAQEPMFRGHLLESETYIGGKVGMA